MGVGRRQPDCQRETAASISRWYLDPGLPRSTGFAPTSSPPSGPHADRVDGGPGPVDLTVIAQPVQQPVMQGLPDAGGLPVAQPPPAGHAAATAQLTSGQESPGDAGPQHIDDPAEHGPVLDPGPGRAWDEAAWLAAAAGWQPRPHRGRPARPWLVSSWPRIIPDDPSRCETSSNSTVAVCGVVAGSGCVERWLGGVVARLTRRAGTRDRPVGARPGGPAAGAARRR
jgi:hypothetical protein